MLYIKKQIVAVSIFAYGSKGVKMKNKNGFIVQPTGFEIPLCCLSPADYDPAKSLYWNLQKKKYTRLLGAIYYNGQVKCGHYRAVVNTLNMTKDTFVVIDDERVGSFVTSEELSDPRGRYCRNCYILFYE